MAPPDEHSSRIADLVAATPPTRDRYIDFLRAASIVVVVLGHWTMAVVEYRDGTWTVGNLLTTFHAGWVLTWLFQVMPVFFFVGGFSNLVTIDAMARDGRGYADFATSRAWRLLKPVLVLLGIWLPIATLGQGLGVLDGVLLRQATGVITQPLWFIGIYLIVTALAPSMREAHRRWGSRVPAALAAAAVAVDLVRFSLNTSTIGYLNFGFVWLFAQQLGFAYADGRLARVPRRAWPGVAVGALGLLVAMTTLGPYPRSMVGLPGESVSNMNPPTACLLVVTIGQVALLMLARPRLTRWLAAPRLWALVIGANAVMMTTFLWHLTALMIVAVLTLPNGLPQPAIGSAAWWLMRPAWLTLLGAVTAVVVSLFARFERPDAAARKAAGGSGPLAAMAMAFLIAGICGFAVSGLVDFVSPGGRQLLALPVSPLINLAALAAGGFLFRIARLQSAPGGQRRLA